MNLKLDVREYIDIKFKEKELCITYKKPLLVLLYGTDYKVTFNKEDIRVKKLIDKITKSNYFNMLIEGRMKYRAATKIYLYGDDIVIKYLFTFNLEKNIVPLNLSFIDENEEVLENVQDMKKMLVDTIRNLTEKQFYVYLFENEFFTAFGSNVILSFVQKDIVIRLFSTGDTKLFLEHLMSIELSLKMLKKLKDLSYLERHNYLVKNKVFSDNILIVETNSLDFLEYVSLNFQFLNENAVIENMSCVYKYNDNYYLIVKGDFLILRDLTEFDIRFMPNIFEALLYEQGELIIADSALEKLNNLFYMSQSDENKVNLKTNKTSIPSIYSYNIYKGLNKFVKEIKSK